MNLFCSTCNGTNWVDTILIAAIKGQNSTAVRDLLNDEKIDPSEYNNAALRIACKRSSLDIVKLLLSHPKVDPSDKKCNALYRSIKSQNYKIFDVLLKHKKVDPNLIIPNLTNHLFYMNKVCITKHLRAILRDLFLNEKITLEGCNIVELLRQLSNCAFTEIIIIILKNKNIKIQKNEDMFKVILKSGDQELIDVYNGMGKNSLEISEWIDHSQTKEEDVPLINDS
jgi:ankyrin repeat protein